ncbi:MAG: chromosome segregation protein SMC [Clostridia bacterium]|nr:chromosome segregation protein SMC [Clostridia bacterium]
MILKSLEIRGFKSFPDKTVLTFGQGITAVVGPNGSGKSNISDAIRWVLGEQSNKALRSGKMEDVIFNGTENGNQSRKAVGFAEVSLTIDNHDRRLDFDADEVRVTRRYYRSGESEYLLNNTTVRLKDVQMLFMDTGLGRDGYSIVGQGRIDEIVASKSSDRREIFEEAAGIAKYRYRKTEAERRLANAEENLLRLNDILKELEERVGPLEHQAKKAEIFLTYAAEKKDLEIGIWLHNLSKAKDTMNTLSGNLEAARQEYETASKSIEDIEKEIENVTSQSSELTVQMETLRQSAIRFDEEASKKEADVMVLKNDIAHFEEDIKRLETDRDTQNSSDQQLDEQLASYEKEIAEREALIEKTTKQQQLLEEKMEALSKSISEHDTRIEEQNTLAVSIAKDLADARVKQGSEESALTEIRAQLSQLESSIPQLEQVCVEAQKEKDEAEKALNVCSETVESLQNTLSGYELRFQTKKDKAEKAKTAYENARLDAEEAKRRVAILEDLERNMDGYSGSTKIILKQSERGALPGICGAVSQLIETPSELSLAIETALGNAAQNVICETENDAKRGITFLKNENAGRVTFLPVETVKGNLLKEDGIENEIGVRGLAADLISYDKKFRSIFVNLLGHVVVADDLDTATAIGRKYGHRFRIVTLDGQVVNAGGSLTGGSHVRGAGLLSRRGEIEGLIEKQKASEKAYQEAKESYTVLEQEASAAQAAFTGAQGELTTAQEDKIRLEGEHHRLSDNLTHATESLESCKTDIETLTTRITEVETNIANAKTLVEDLTAKQDNIESIITTISGGQDEIASSRTDLSTKLSDVRLEIVGYEKEIEGIRGSMSNLEERKKDADGFRASINDQIEEIRQKIEEKNTEIVGLQEQAALGHQHAQDARDTVDDLLNQQLSGETSVTELRNKSRELSNDKERLSNEVTRLEEKVERAEQETDDITRKLYEEYELTKSQAEEVATIPENIPEANRRLNELRSKIRALGNVNVGAIEEYKEVSERYNFLSEQVKDVEISRKEILTLINDLTTQMREMFVVRFKQINESFGKIFVELFGGGKASLKLENEDDILESGILMDIQPPGKVVLNLNALSGGEKALTAISLLFAILRVTPSPFCVLDEIDAALDDVNVNRYASFLRNMTEDTQFIVITHRRGTMEEADVLYGVTMQEKGVTKLLELRASEVEEQLGIQLEDMNS